MNKEELKYKLSKAFIAGQKYQLLDGDINLRDYLESIGLGDELEVGKVYKGEYEHGRKFIFCHHHLESDGDSVGYGFAQTNKDYPWEFDGDAYFTGKDVVLKPATDAEWSTALIAEWEKTPTNRKFKNYSYHFNNTVGMKGLMFGWDVLGEELFTVFDNGKWATVIESVPEYTMQQLIDKVGEGEFKIKK